MRPPAKSIKVHLVALLLAVHHIRCRSIHAFAGPYIIFVHRVSSCPSDGSNMVVIRVSHYNPVKPFDPQLVSGNITMKRDFADNIWVAAVMDVRSNNQWKENAFVINFPYGGCTMGREQAPDLFRFLAKISGTTLPKKGPCVIPAGTYCFKDEPLSWAFPQFRVMPYGRYRLQLRTGRQGNPTTRFCTIVDLSIIPKP